MFTYLLKLIESSTETRWNHTETLVRGRNRDCSARQKYKTAGNKYEGSIPITACTQYAPGRSHQTNGRSWRVAT